MAKERITFDDFYQAQYGERWKTLKAAMLSQEEDKTTIPGLLAPYYMDRTSIETANLLPLDEAEDVLDMCAAPGGKTIVLLTRLQGKASLVSNDRSADRRERMRRAVSQSVPSSFLSRWKITGHDASRWGLYEKEAYDAILLDAPCSSERHVIQSTEYLKDWSPSRPKRLQALQYTMFTSAILALRSGGYLLYSTCSINRAEDDGIVSRFMTKHPGEAEVIPVSLEYGENLDYGSLVLPDKSRGRGPMYAVLLRKI